MAALAADPNVLEKSGAGLHHPGLAREYGFTDVDGKQQSASGTSTGPRARGGRVRDWIGRVDVTRVERDEIAVMFIRTPDDVEAFGPAFERLEGLVGLRGRKFYGAFYPREKEYRACVEVKEGDDPEALGLESRDAPGRAVPPERG